MSLRIQNNIEAFNAHRQLSLTSSKMGKAMERLSSGYRINRAADDAAGLAISEKLRAQIGGLAQAQRNALDAVSLVQTAEGALQEVHTILQRVRDLSVQYENGTLSASDKTSIATEISELGQEIGRIRDTVAFNNQKLLDGSTPTVTFQVGANDGQTITISTLDVYSSSSTVMDSDFFTSYTSQTNRLSTLDGMIATVATHRATFGSTQNRLEHTLNNLSAYEENLRASESRIRDVDMASEMVSFTKLQILQQAGTSMLAQANQLPQSVLSLLRS
ncbi:MAG: flagellin [Gaiellales bacterium]